MLSKFFKTYVYYKLNRINLFSVMYRITNRCNLRCTYCSLWKDKFREATTEEAKYLMDQLVKANVTYMTFSGGEPTLRKDLTIISRYAMKRGIFTTLNTNGTLINRKKAYEYLTSFNVISVSIDGFEKTHNMLRGNNSYKNAVRGIENLIDAKNSFNGRGAKIGINTIIHPDNLDDIIPLFEKYAPDVNFVAFQPLHPPTDIDFKKLDKLIIDLLQFKKRTGKLFAPDYYIKYLHKFFKGQSMKICGAGKDFALLNSDGSLFACPFIYGPLRDRLKLGNLLEEDIITILRSPHTKKVIELLKNCNGCMNEWSLIRFYFDHPLQLLPYAVNEIIS